MSGTFPAQFGRWAAAAAAVSVLAGCVAPPGGARAVPSYDPFTSRMLQIGADLNGDGRLDQWTYLDGPRTIRGEADTDHDGRIDRWEYFDEGSALVVVGTSSANDGVEDTWTLPPGADGVVRVEKSRNRDGARDRVEFFRGAVLERSEEDTNADGLVDRWERFENGVLRDAGFDTTFVRGRPDRRLIYDAAGRFEGIEIDPDGSGRFERLPPGAR